MARARTILLSSVGVGIAVWSALHFSGIWDSSAATVESPPGSAKASEEREPSTGGAQEAETARLRGEVALLRAQVAAIREERGQPDSAPSRPAATAEEETSPAMRGRDPAMIARDTQIREAYIQGLESMFRRESSDPKWAASAISAIQAALGADKVGLSSRNTECRAQTCRLEIPDDGSGKVNAALPVLASQLATVLPYVDADQVDDGAGGKTVVLYLANSRPNLPPGP